MRTRDEDVANDPTWQGKSIQEVRDGTRKTHGKPLGVVDASLKNS